MPLFGNKFAHKKTQPRKWPSMSNLNLDVTDRNGEFDSGPIKMSLNGRNMIFDNGQWISAETESNTTTNSKKIGKENDRLIKRNNLLTLKVETLIDLLTKTMADVQILENENEQLKRIKRN